MVEYGSNWYTNDIFCQRCSKSRRGISLRSIEMSKKNLSLDLCANCLSDIASETKDLRH